MQKLYLKIECGRLSCMNGILGRWYKRKAYSRILEQQFKYDVSSWNSIIETMPMSQEDLSTIFGNILKGFIFFLIHETGQ